ncbi:hypothetical protein FMM68_04965 [Lachnospiraceae bacterium MD329]|nr:hypothetical protein [Lachnospiraceae bacterium MD329]
MILKKVTAIAIHLIPIFLWFLLGITTGMTWEYYVLCGVLSVFDIVHIFVHSSEAIRYIEHHTEEVR